MWWWDGFISNLHTRKSPMFLMWNSHLGSAQSEGLARSCIIWNNFVSVAVKMCASVLFLWGAAPSMSLGEQKWKWLEWLCVLQKKTASLLSEFPSHTAFRQIKPIGCVCSRLWLAKINPFAIVVMKVCFRVKLTRIPSGGHITFELSKADLINVFQDYLKSG